jgi:hypothetical protein
VFETARVAWELGWMTAFDPSTTLEGEFLAAKPTIDDCWSFKGSFPDSGGPGSALDPAVGGVTEVGAGR